MKKGKRPQKSETHIFTAKFDHYKEKKNKRNKIEKTVHLKNIRDENGKLVTAKQGFPMVDEFTNLGELQKDDELKFTAEMTQFNTGYSGPQKFGGQQQQTFKLSNPHDIEKL